ncbi:MAG: hypothetical protein HUU14_07705, partial [Dehalococcoidia bacterium]|nr:hypothetical protein [Dehalococcoidia bacterium]
FSLNNQQGEWWCFVRDPAAPDVALRAVLRRPPADGDKALIVGAGILGLLMAQAVRAVNPNCFLGPFCRHSC